MNYYDVLGINKSATDADIKKAYRRLASKHHPDKGGNHADFQKIQEAYDILGDKTKRQEYDNPQIHSGGPFFSGAFNFNDGPHHFRQPPRRNPNVSCDVNISLEDAFKGTDIGLNLGSSSEVITLPPGAFEGMKLRIPGKGPRRFTNCPPGDVIVRIHVNCPTGIAVQGKDIFSIHDLNVLDALTGGSIPVTLIDKTTVRVKIPPGTSQNTKFKIPKKGMPDHNNIVDRGDHFLVVNLFVPKLSNPDHLERLKSIKEEIENE